ncbi:DUF4097 family beta strand repeat-containing protein [Streptomyces sp. NPDC052000]|uniref:DUF4097 family beta strand repeat-containing protein n=1 Tax=Streptomyces sp. NPDC052000 TaxID=3155676 RepID=UPI003450298C
MSTAPQLRLRSIAAVTLTALAVGGLGACGALNDKVVKDDSKVAQKITSVRIDTASGGVRLRGKQGLGEVAVHREITYRNAKPEGPTYHVENGVLVLGGCPGHCSVDYTVDVPAGIPVTGSTDAGALHLSSVGEVKVSTSDGGVKVHGAAGPVDIRTTNGSIEADALKGTATTARTSNGSISLTPATVQNVTAQTTNGAISVTAPSAQYQVSTQTQSGNKKLGIPDTASAAHHLNLSTSNGDISVRSAK